MDAGPALDAEIARLLGHHVRELCPPGTRSFDAFEATMYPPGTCWLQTNRSGWEPLRPYSTDIAAAWLVVERMRDAGWVGIVTRDNGVGHYAEFWRLLDTGIIDSHRSENESSCPLAICLAALDAIADKQGA
jgi:hypothetical protein